jgi:hypothetical protein
MQVEKQWQKFWDTRSHTKINIKPFVKNFKYIVDALNIHYDYNEDNGIFQDMDSLEVGSGRGIISDMLYACGIAPYKIDKYYNPSDRTNFWNADVFDMPFPEGRFDIAFTYGLLEHFCFDDQMTIIEKILYVTKPYGVNIHYVVPKKLTNIFEDSDVARHECYELRKVFPHQWVFPCFRWFNWRTNKWFGKGFFIVINRGQIYKRIGNSFNIID